jgi:hypothetical protein
MRRLEGAGLRFWRDVFHDRELPTRSSGDHRSLDGMVDFRREILVQRLSLAS